MKVWRYFIKSIYDEVSDVSFGQQTILRTAPDTGVSGDEVIDQLITGVLSGLTATVESSTAVIQGGQSISELGLQIMPLSQMVKELRKLNH